MPLDYDLHPSIDLPAEEVRIADQGCGNGAWLISLAADLQHTKASFTGLDIHSSHFPAPGNLPPNFKLGLLDALSEELPDEHAGQYDIVHIRAFSSVSKGDDPAPVIKKAYRMLKPGGYLQWDELDGGSLKAVAPGSESTISTSAMQEMVATSLQSQAAMNLKFSWIGKLDKLLEQQGFDSVEYKRTDIKKELRSVMTLSLLLIHEHVARLAVRDG